VTVIEFNGHVCACTHVAANGQAVSVGRKGSTTPLAGGLAAAALRVAGAGASGGTSYDAALRMALDGLPNGLRDERADLVFVTDGECDVSDVILADLAKQKAQGMRVYGLTVNGGSVGEAVGAICDHVVDIDSSRGDAGEIANALPV
jgi:uncharacterized protein with von Willebrand factor type A (vWA) domain